MRSEAAALSGNRVRLPLWICIRAHRPCHRRSRVSRRRGGCDLDLLQFDLAAAVVHRKGASPVLLFHTFDAIGGREGIENYVAVTHKVNPMLARATGSLGTFRARDFHMRALGAGAKVRRFLVPSPDEELGFRTVGWPAKLEEVGVYFEPVAGLVEFSFYRERRPQRAADDVMTRLEALRAPLAAAFDRHAELTRAAQCQPADSFTTAVAPRNADRRPVVARLRLGSHCTPSRHKPSHRKGLP